MSMDAEVTLWQISLLVIGSALGILQTAAIMMFKSFTNKLREFCKQNLKEHDELWYDHKHHKHTAEGDVVIPLGSGK